MRTFTFFVALACCSIGVYAQNERSEEFIFEDPDTKEKTRMEIGSSVTISTKTPIVSITGTVLAVNSTSVTLGISRSPYRRVIPVENIARVKLHDPTTSLSEISSAPVSGFRMTVGYGFGIASDLAHTASSTTYTGTGFTGSTKGTYGTYGSGFYLTAAYTKMFTSGLGLDLAVHYLSGDNHTGTSSDKYPGGSETMSIRSTSTGLFISPSLVIQITEGKFQPFVRMGFLLGTIKLEATLDDNISAGSSSGHADRKEEYTGGLPFGLKGGLGLSYKVSDRFKVFTELTFISLSYYPDHLKVTAFHVNGVDQLSSMSVSEKETDYKDNYSYQSGPGDPTKPSVELKQSVPMSSISINAGISISLGK